MAVEKSKFLGVDVNSETLTIAALGSGGRVTCRAQAHYRIDVPRPGWTEQDPAVWWNAFVQACRQLQTQTDLSFVSGIGLTGQMHSTVLLDRHGDVLMKSLLWNDNRSSDSALRLEQTVEAGRIKEITGNRVMPAFTAAKLQWIKEHEPDIFSRIDKVLLPKDYIRYRLTGELATDVTDGSGTAVFCVEKRTWSDELIQAFDFRREWFPDVYESSSIVSRVSSDSARLLGLTAGIPVIAGAGDNSAAAIGAGIVGHRQGLVRIGSSGAVLVTTDDPAMFRYSVDQTSSIHNFCHAMANTWISMGTTLSAQLALHWFYDALTVDAPQLLDGFVNMSRQALATRSLDDSLLFLPYLGGERTPHIDPKARGVFFGLNFKHDVRHMIRAVMEGVAFSMRDCMQVIRQANLSVEDLRLTGEVIHDGTWCQIVADVLGAELCVPVHQGAAEGIALLAGLSLGLYDMDMIVEKPCIAHYVPDETYQAHYDVLHDKYQALYRAVARLF
ncbi:MAG: xylulokinase [Bacilli bacterium]